MSRAQRVAAAFVKAGVPVSAVDDSDDMVDGNVDLPKGFHVQVPDYGPVMLGRQIGESFEFYPEDASVKAVIARYQAVAAKV